VTAATVVIGVGNPWRADDGAGPAVARSLAGRLPPGVVAVELTGEPGGLIEALAGAATAIVVDAVSSGAPPGTVHRLAGADGLALAAATSTHGLSVGQALELAGALGLLPGRLVLYCIEVGGVGHGEGLSPAVARAVEEVADLVLRDVGPARSEASLSPPAPRGRR
jgi:hydrogenase maturation protease